MNSKKFEEVRDPHASCYRKTLSILNIVTLLNFMQYNAVQQGSDYRPTAYTHQPNFFHCTIQLTEECG